MKDPILFFDDEVTTHEDNDELFIFPCEFDTSELKVGGKNHRPMHKKLNESALAEAYLSYFKLQKLDLRCFWDKIRAHKSMNKADLRFKKDKTEDAKNFILKMTATDKSFLTITRQGREYAKKIYNMTSTELTKHMKNGELDFARFNNLSDEDIALSEKAKIDALFHACGRAAEIPSLIKEVLKKINIQEEIHPIYLDGKYPLRNLLEPFLIARYACVNPCNLWPAELRRYYNVFEFICISSENSRGITVDMTKLKILTEFMRSKLSGLIPYEDDAEEYWIELTQDVDNTLAAYSRPKK